MSSPFSGPYLFPCYCILATCIAFIVSLFFCISEQASRGFIRILFLCGHGIILWHLPTEKNCFSIPTRGFLFLLPFCYLLFDASCPVLCVNRLPAILSARLLSGGTRLRAAELTSNIVVRYIHKLYLREEGPKGRANSKTRSNVKASGPCDHDLAVVGSGCECCVRCTSSVRLEPMYLFTAFSISL